MTRPKVIWHNNNINLLGIRFRPGCARGAIGIGLQEMTDRSVAVEDIDVRLRHELEWVAQALTARDRHTRLETVLVKRFQRADTSRALVQNAVRIICRARGRITIARLESMFGTSARSLERRFLERVGLTPKTFCRIVRFQNTVSILNRRRTVSAMDLVDAGGFFDQSHLLREFKALAGLVPTAWISERDDVGFVQYIEPLLDYTGIPRIDPRKDFSECQDTESISIRQPQS